MVSAIFEQIEVHIGTILAASGILAGLIFLFPSIFVITDPPSLLQLIFSIVLIASGGIILFEIIAFELKR